MGVEYRHFLVTGEPAWLPVPGTLGRVEDVLRKWRLVTEDAKVFDLSGGQELAISEIPTTPGAGIAAVYPKVEGPVVAALFGPSYYDNSTTWLDSFQRFCKATLFGVAASEHSNDQERYIQQIAIVVGTDYRIQWSSEEFCFSVVKPPLEGGREVAPYPEGSLGLYDAAYPAAKSTVPPRVEIEVSELARDHVAWRDFPGFWRGAVVLDFGKDIPAFAAGQYILGCREFVSDISMAFRTRICEVGEID